MAERRLLQKTLGPLQGLHATRSRPEVTQPSEIETITRLSASFELWQVSVTRFRSRPCRSKQTSKDDHSAESLSPLCYTSVRNGSEHLAVRRSAGPAAGSLKTE
jgi:hypothetical protein